MAPAKTGRDKRSKTVVVLAAHKKRVIRSRRRPSGRLFKMVVIKLRAPRIDETPARCSEKIAKSTEGPLWAVLPDRGGYTVHPVPTPFSTRELHRSKIRAGGSSQNLILLRRGNIISGPESIKGISQLPNPPIIIGITRKKIIKNA